MCRVGTCICRREECEALAAQCSQLHEDYKFKRSQRLGIKTEKAALEADKREAEAYLADREQLEHLRLQAFLWQLYHIQHGMDTATHDVEGLVEDLAAAEAAESDAAAELKQAQTQYAGQRRKRTQAEREVANLTKSVDTHSTAAAETQQAVFRVKKSVLTHQNKASQAEGDIAKVRHEVAAVQEELQGLNSKLAELEGVDESDRRASSGSAAARGVSLNSKEMTEYTKLKASARQRTVDGRQAMEKLEREQSTDRDTFAELSSRLASFLSRVAEAEREIAATKSKLLKFAETQVAESAAVKEAQAQATRLEEEMHVDISRQESLASELQEVQSKLREARDVRRSSDAEKAAATALEDMKRLYTGVRGRLVDLVVPSQGRFSTAVDTALGKLGDAVVVDSGDVAAECIQYLRTHQVRPFSFLPLDSIKAPEPSQRLAHLNGPYRLATEVIVCEDEPSRPALDFVVGNVVVADTLEDATRLRFERRVVCKVVTLDGSIVAKNGHMTGGATRGGNGRRRFDEKALASLKSRRDELLSEEEQLRRRTGSGPSGRARSKVGRLIESVKNTMKVGQNKLNALADAQTRLEQRTAQREKELENIQGEVGELQPKADALSAAIDERQTKLDKLQGEVHGAEDEVFGAFCARLQIGSIRDYESTVVAEAAERSRKADTLRDARSKLQSKLDYESSRLKDLENLKVLAETSVLKAQAAVAAAETASAEADEEVQRTRLALGAAMDTLEDTNAAYKAQEDGMRRAKQARAVAHKEALDVQKRIAAHEALLEKRRAARHDLLVKARVAQVTVPMLGKAPSGGDSATGSSSAASTEQSEGGDTGTTRSVAFSKASGSQVLRDAKAAQRIDFSHMEKQPPAQPDGAAVAETTSEYERAIASLERRLATSQPNMKSVEQYDAVAARYIDAQGEERGAKGAHEEVLQRLQKVQAQRENTFYQCFKAVNQRVQRIYADMTRSEAAKGGGVASLYVEQDDSAVFGDMPAGIMYKAQPPNKRSRDMAGLSGGERTVAALALLFAMHDYAPAPFCVLDEIDDALDNSNVRLVCDYIRRRSSSTPEAVALRQRAAHNARALARRVSGGASNFALEADKPLQCIVISLKNAFYSNADCLVGVYRDVAVDGSKVLTLDLGQFADHAPLSNSGASGASSTPIKASGRRATVLPTHASTPGSQDDDAASVAASEVGSVHSAKASSTRFRRGNRFRRSGASENGSVISDAPSAISSVMSATMRRLSGAAAGAGAAAGGVRRPRLALDDDESDAGSVVGDVEGAALEAKTSTPARRRGKAGRR